jgi:hypothetical protein
MNEIPRMLGYNAFPKDELLGDQSVLGSGSVRAVHGITGSGTLLVEPVTATGATANSISGPSSITNLLDPFEEASYVVTMEGTGAGQRRQVVGIVPDRITGEVVFTVSPNWETEPDETTIFKVVGSPDSNGMTGEPSLLYARSDHIERTGQLYRCRYRIEVSAYPQEAMLYLFTVVKAILMTSRPYLQKQGFMNTVLGATDLAPIPDLYPQIAYRRSLTVEFVHSFDIFAEVTQPVASKILLALSVHNPDVQNPGDSEFVVSETELILS